MACLKFSAARRTVLCIVPILVATVLLPQIVSVAHAQDENGFQSLFDGSTTDGWTRYGDSHGVGGWIVQDGTLHRAAEGGDIMSLDQFGDFDFRFEWKVAPRGNSGVMYRVKVTKDPAYFTGPEYQVLDDPNDDGKASVTSAASLYGLYAPTSYVVRPAGQWNTGRIVVQGNHVQHWLNDTLVVEATLGTDDWNQRVRDSKFRDWDQFARAPQGHIVLQDHGDPVWYRNLRIKSLD